MDVFTNFIFNYNFISYNFDFTLPSYNNDVIINILPFYTLENNFDYIIDILPSINLNLQ